MQTAKAHSAVGEIEETLKWGEPSYGAINPKTGTAIRIDWKEKSPDYYAVFVNCQTSLIADFRLMHPTAFAYDGTRSIRIDIKTDLNTDVDKRAILTQFIVLALTYFIK